MKPKPKKKDSFKSDSEEEKKDEVEYENFEHNFAAEIDPKLEKNEEYVEKLGVLLL